METVGVVSDRDMVDTLFEAFAGNHLETFLSGCAEQLLVTFRGTSDVATVLSRGELSTWWDGLSFLADGPVKVDVTLLMATGPSVVVVLAYAFMRDGRPRRYETVNYCTVRDGLLAAWFASPLDRGDYSDAWDVAVAESATRRTKRKVGARASSRD